MKKEQNFTQPKKKSAWREVIGIFWALVIALLIRSCALEPYDIPSGSMYPTLLVGDHLFITKHDYGYSRHSFLFSLPIIPKGQIFATAPKQGDVVVFRMTPQIQPHLPRNIDYIKRVIGLPGDTVQVKEGRLYINDKLVERQQTGTEFFENTAEAGEMILGQPITQKIPVKKYVETLPNGVMHTIYEHSDNTLADNTEKITVPEGHFFAMGDNRDFSLDSRFFGVVPFENLEGKARFIYFSNNGAAPSWQLWRINEYLRPERLFTGIF